MGGMLVPTGVWILPESHPSKGVAPGSKNLISSALGPRVRRWQGYAFPLEVRSMGSSLGNPSTPPLQGLRVLSGKSWHVV